MLLTLKTNLVMPSGVTSILKKQKMRLLTSFETTISTNYKGSIKTEIQAKYCAKLKKRVL